ncbi:MAG: RNA polymerase sigma-70 factor [Actinomycetota bacterium]
MSEPPRPPDATEVFEANRHHLFGVAYRMLGSVAEAEDAVQEAWLRWSAAEWEGVRNPRGWLTTVVGRLALDRLRSAQHRRETYVGPWLPEPLVRLDDDPADHAELADTLSLAFLTMLERLDPVERAAFLLREVFGHGYDEVARTVDRSETACRQIVHRAKERLDPDRPVRFDPGPDEERRLVDSFLAAALGGDVDGLHGLLAEDVVAWSDGGPNRRAARNPIIGRDRVGIFITGIAGRRADDLAIAHVRVNGGPGIAVTEGGAPLMVMSFQLSPTGIQSIHAVLAPEKLAGITEWPT